MHTVFALLCFVVLIHWLIFPYPSGLLHWHCGNLTIAPVPAKQPWRIWINTSCAFIMIDWITTTKQSTTKPCAYFLGYTVYIRQWTKPWLVDVMACHVFGTKPLSQPMLPNWKLNTNEHFSVKFYWKFESFHSRKYTWKCRLRNRCHFVSA